MTLKTGAEAGQGLALGAWGAAQATAAGLSIFLGGAGRDLVVSLASKGILSGPLAMPATSYSIVYHTEIALIFLTLVVLGPLVRLRAVGNRESIKLGLADFPT
jgi:BCD family chlorophyll transporter-like MFS transporter